MNILQFYKKIIIFILFLLLLAWLITKKFFDLSSSNESITKKLMNYITNDKEIHKNSNYKTIEFADDEKRVPTAKNEKTKKDKKYEENYLDTSDSLYKIIEKESQDKLAKLTRFGLDYCRASPNITLKRKSLLDIGWRNQKYIYEVDYEVINYKGDKLAV